MKNFKETQYSEAITHLVKWKKLHSISSNFAELVAYNIFLKQYAIESFYSTIEDCFGKISGKVTDISMAYQGLLSRLNQEIGDIMPKISKQFLISNGSKPIGGLRFEIFIPIIEKFKHNSLKNDGYEELCTGYIVNHITNHMILLWAAIGAIGNSKTQSLNVLSGGEWENIDDIGLEYSEMYGIIEQELVLPFVLAVDSNVFHNQIQMG